MVQSPPSPPSGHDWYITDWSRNPKAEYVFDVAVGDAMWDPRGKGFDGSYGACDLVWYPGWLIPSMGGWPTVGYNSWPT